LRLGARLGALLTTIGWCFLYTTKKKTKVILVHYKKENQSRIEA